ncbi:UvrD-helicase domain-containing protein [Rhodoferax sp. AJA081-3]|uniref:UvrD-helicase domain-containing protein n=1 Tax=Rhodoferax sp. AJA081-3 TaxID=2752316 RepID=UPI001ADF149A|nr:UvrD-helicase domain-containing protein [Rhodoferax sp. AJA081-3]QTN28544.1 UvrD-helicase domain-containing protein [Rhodoferax sp. AJA081-3]
MTTAHDDSASPPLEAWAAERSAPCPPPALRAPPLPAQNALPPRLLAAFEHNGATVERARFYAIACDPRRSVAVEACAGAGKTWMLVSRIVRALLEGSAPHEILAITFTKKAAGEMRQRLQEWLLHFSHQSDTELRQELIHRGLTQEPTPAQLQTLRGLHETLLMAGRPVQIRTFHSWFAALLRSAPLQALADLGLPTQYELLENDAKAVALVWPRFQSGVAAEPDARQDYLDAVATHGRHQTHKALEEALNKRVEFALADEQGIVDASVLHFAQQFPAFTDVPTPAALLRSARVRGLLLDAARLLGASTLKTCLEAATALEQAVSADDLAAVQDALLTQKGTPRKLSDKLTGIETVRQAQDCLIEIAQAQAQHAAWLHQQRMARLTRLLVVEYAQLKRERGWIDMGDLERSALALMSDEVLSGWVQERLDARVRHLLIDEFQDTNPLQWQALSAWLSSYAGAGNAPSVFLVGDPKQSIYRFRRAEPQVFKAAQRFVADGLGGDLLSCDHTRRNAPAIIGLVNDVMAQAQEAREFEGFRAHSTESQAAGAIFKLPRLGREAADEAAASATVGECANAESMDAAPAEEGLAAHWRDSLTTPRLVAEETRKTLGCRQAARWLAQQLQTGALKPQDIMVLARKRERLSLMQAELSKLRIPAQQPEKSELADMPEVQDLIGLLDALVSPAHDLSLARALKSPLFSVTDDDLVQLVLRQRAFLAAGKLAAQASLFDEVDASAEAATKPLAKLSWFQVLQQTTDLPPTLTPIGATLALWKSWVDTLPPHDALSAIYHHGDVLARFASATPANQRDAVLANLRALLSAALQVDGGRYVTAYALVRALRAGGNPAPVRADAQAVRLLTVHGAKGLEAPLVLLLDTDGEALKAQTMGVLVDWPGEAAYPQRFVYLASESKPPSCVADVLAIEQAARKREELNALYVALTRTQHTLVVSSLQPHIPNAGSWWQRLEAHAAEAPWQAVDNAATTSVEGVVEALFSLPVLPNMPLAPVEYSYAATNSIVDAETGDAADSLDSRIGQAMHRLLERYVPAPSGASRAPAWPDALHSSVAQEFDLDAAQLATAQGMAVRILQGEGAWAWDATQLNWQGNEVGLVYQGRLLRLDRLVQRRTDGRSGAGGADDGQWWVLDYKSNAQPHMQPALCAQLLEYQAAVAKAYAGHTVRAAFLTAFGTLIELPTP